MPVLPAFVSIRPTHGKIRYRPDIDGLRALAVSSVVLFHAFPVLMPGGFIGVDVFFVISGYLITSIILERLEAQRFSFAEFYARRVLRIFPALIIMLVTCLIVGWFVLVPYRYEQLGRRSLLAPRLSPTSCSGNSPVISIPPRRRSLCSICGLSE